jgi:hypothetical protein
VLDGHPWKTLDHCGDLGDRHAEHAGSGGQSLLPFLDFYLRVVQPVMNKPSHWSLANPISYPAEASVVFASASILKINSSSPLG